MKNLLILSQSYAHRDPRILRQIRALKDEYKITMVGYTPSEVAGVTELPLFENTGFRKSGLFQKVKRVFFPILGLNSACYWNQNHVDVVEELKKSSYDLIIANEIDTLPIAYELRKHCGRAIPIWCDLHEYYIGQYSTNPIWRYSRQKQARYLCKNYFGDVNAFSTVSPGIVELYKEHLGIDCELITNARAYEEIDARAPEDDKIKLVHHGIAVPGRKLELMIEMMDHLDDRFSLDFYLVQNIKSYADELKSMAVGKAIQFHDPVKYEDIVSTINKFDVGVFLLPPTNINYAHALPNKLFEFVQARLAVAIGPTPDMQRLVDEFDLGVVSQDFSVKGFAKALSELTKESITKFKQNSAVAARAVNAEKNYEIIRDIISKLEDKIQ